LAGNTGDRIKIVIGYALWAALCAAFAGVAVSVIHTAFFSYHAGPHDFWRTLFDDVVTALMIAAGQGAVALVSGSVLAQLGRSLHATVLLGLLVGLFDFVMLFLQMAVPRTELGWVPDLVILAVVTLGITILGSRPATLAPPGAPASPTS
jgi:hypothetical protein